MDGHSERLARAAVLADENAKRNAAKFRIMYFYEHRDDELGDVLGSIKDPHIREQLESLVANPRAPCKAPSYFLDIVKVLARDAYGLEEYDPQVMNARRELCELLSPPLVIHESTGSEVVRGGADMHRAAKGVLMSLCASRGDKLEKRLALIKDRQLRKAAACVVLDEQAYTVRIYHDIFNAIAADVYGLLPSDPSLAELRQQLCTIMPIRIVANRPVEVRKDDLRQTASGAAFRKT